MISGQRVPIAARIERLPSSRYMTSVILLIAFGTFWVTYMLFSVGPIRCISLACWDKSNSP